jgi:purine-binding chemotaxis protein CheW
MAIQAVEARARACGGHYLTFELAGQEYGVDILRVQEIKGWDRVTRIPNMPEYVLGVINLRGAIVPVIDMRRRFAMEPAAFGRTTVIVVLRVDTGARSRTMGLVVDAVSDVVQCETEEAPPPDLGGGVDVSFIRSLAMFDERMVIVIDVDRLLGDTELVVAAQA